MWSPVCTKIILSTAALERLRLLKLDVKTAFLQTGKDDRDVYILPPRESSKRYRCVWLLCTAAYGLVNPNVQKQLLRS